MEDLLGFALEWLKLSLVDEVKFIRGVVWCKKGLNNVIRTG